MKYRIIIHDGHLQIDATVNVNEAERLRTAIKCSMSALEVLTKPMPITKEPDPVTLMEGSDDDIILTSSIARTRG